MLSVKEALIDLKDAIDRARLRLSVHEAGWITRWRTFDARHDNVLIEKKAKQLMMSLDIFTKLIQCPLVVDGTHKHKEKKKNGYTEYTNTL